MADLILDRAVSHLRIAVGQKYGSEPGSIALVNKGVAVSQRPWSV
jgi:hypothetical protein